MRTWILIAALLGAVAGMPAAAQQTTPQTQEEVVEGDAMTDETGPAAAMDQMGSMRRRDMRGDHHGHHPRRDKGVMMKVARHKRGHELRILKPEVSRELKILPVPTPEPIPLLIGHYWRCIQSPGDFEFCEPVLVVCNTEQTLCTEH